MTLALFAALTLAAQIQVELAPDQPVPHVYVDDPLILELSSAQPAHARVTVEAAPDFGGDPATLDLGPLDLNSNATLWRVLDGLPALRGRYALTTRIDTGDGTPRDVKGMYCRIDRPIEGSALPLLAELAYSDSAALACKAIGVRAVRLHATPDTGEAIATAAAAGFSVTVSLDAAMAGHCDKLVRGQGAHVAAWELAPGAQLELVAEMAKTLRQAGSRAPIFVALQDAALIEPLLAAGLGALLEGVVYEAAWADLKQLAALRASAEAHGYEHLHLVAGVSGEEAAAADAGRLAPDLAALLGQTEGVALGTTLLYSDTFGPGYVYAGAFNQRLGNQDYVGRMALPEGVESRVFRQGAGWTAVLWATAGPREESVAVGSASGLARYDARNNPLPVAEIKEGVLAVDVTPEPQFLTGTGGAIVGLAAQAEVAHEAAVLLASEDLKKALPDELHASIGKFAVPGGHTRTDFFNLLKAFPTIEELWHAAKMPRRVAVPALAGLHRLALRLAIVEQERNEPFIEPLQTILANCGQRLSLYLTSSATSAVHERSDWLLEEINALTLKAEALSKEGRTIEANALANLAEWRARALESASRSLPLGMAEPEPAPPPPPPPPAPAPPEVTKQDEPEKKAEPPAKKAPASSKSKRSSRGKTKK